MASPPRGLSRPSSNVPLKGDRCKIRGRQPTGKLRHIDAANWCWVDWEQGPKGPRVVHLFELEKLGNTGSTAL
jgi:hypothetical protein